MEIVEKRNFVRVPFSCEAILKLGKTRIKGKIENLSVGGAFITTPEKIERDSEIEIEIFLADPPSDLRVIVSAKVVRLMPEGIAVQFTRISWDVFERLREVISSTHGDERRIVAEFLKYVDLNPFFLL